MTLICVDLEKILGPSKLPKQPKPPRIKREPKPPRALTRVPGLEKNVAIGMKLLALRATIKGNCAFGRAVRRQFDIDAQDAAEMMKSRAGLWQPAGDLHAAFVGCPGHVVVAGAAGGRARGAGKPYPRWRGHRRSRDPRCTRDASPDGPSEPISGRCGWRLKRNSSANLPYSRAGLGVVF